MGTPTAPGAYVLPGAVLVDQGGEATRGGGQAPTLATQSNDLSRRLTRAVVSLDRANSNARRSGKSKGRPPADEGVLTVGGRPFTARTPFLTRVNLMKIKKCLVCQAD